MMEILRILDKTSAWVMNVLCLIMYYDYFKARDKELNERLESIKGYKVKKKE